VRGDRPGDDTPQSVLVCAACHGPTIADNLGAAMVFWNQGGPLVLAHKKCLEVIGDKLSYSLELWCWAREDLALRRLAQLSSQYDLPKECLERLIDIAWAVPHVATDQDKEAAASRQLYY
jgi:hypothetical protein